MAIKKYFNRIYYINHMIKTRATGDLVSFAKRNNLSKSSLSEILSDMKEMGFPIKYDRIRKSYYYEESGDIPKNLFIRFGDILERDELLEIGKSSNLCFSENSIFIPCSKK